jgi:hypothetical protein
MVGMGLLTLAVSWTSTTAGTLKKQAPTLVASRTALPPRGRCAYGLKPVPRVLTDMEGFASGRTLPPARELKTWQVRALVAMTLPVGTRLGRLVHHRNRPSVLAGRYTACRRRGSKVVAPKDRAGHFPVPALAPR